MMAIESALIPLPSEVIMPFSGFLASTGRFSIHLVALSGAIGNVLGGSLAYGLGYWGHEKVVRRLIRRYGKYILFTEHELDKAEGWMHHHKHASVLVSRVVPGIRTIISLPAGIFRLPFGKFLAMTFIGSLVWSYFLAYIGFVLGTNWKSIQKYFHSLDLIVILLIMVGVGYYIFRKMRD